MTTGAATTIDVGGTRLARNLCSGSAASFGAVDDVARRGAVIASTAAVAVRCRRSRRLLAAVGLILFNSLSGACQIFILLCALLALETTTTASHDVKMIIE